MSHLVPIALALCLALSYGRRSEFTDKVDRCGALNALTSNHVSGQDESHLRAQSAISAAYEKQEPLPWDKIAPRLKTGDLILFNSNAGMSTSVIKIGTWSDFTHVALVVAMKFNPDTSTWSVMTEQDSNTVLCLMEVANHPTEDIVTADKYHGFQISRLLDKVSHSEDGVYDYAGVTFVPLKRSVSDEALGKLQSIVSCLHTVRTRYESGSRLGRLMLMTMRMNKGEDLTSMFCSDFVAYVAFEMGWLRPADIKQSPQYSSKNFSPQDLLSHIGPSAWNGDQATPLDVASAGRVFSSRSPTTAEWHTHFPSKASEYWLKRTRQYEHELLQCHPSKLTYLTQHFPAADQHFRSTLWEELRTQQLWGGEVSYVNGNGKTKTKYIRLVARVNDDGSRTGAIYSGDSGTDWYPNNILKLKMLSLQTENDVQIHAVPSSTAFTFTVKIAEDSKTAGRSDSGYRSFTVSKPGDRTYGLFVSTLLNKIRLWASCPMSKTCAVAGLGRIEAVARSWERYKRPI